jgi:esterase/lipase superfamily enzyme
VRLGLGEVIAYGHYGRPLLAFPAEAGGAEDFEEHGLVSAIADLLDAGRVKLYCVGSADAVTWSDRTAPMEERARRHEGYEGWLLDEVAPWIAQDCGGASDIMTVGVSMGAYHAVNLTLRHADRFPLAIGLSGNYDPTSWHAWGEQGEATYFNNPMSYVPNLHGEHLDWLRSRVSVLLVVGQGAWEVQPTRALPSTQQLAGLLREKGIRCELDVWGFDIPHDWPSWCAQLRHHLPRFC